MNQAIGMSAEEAAVFAFPNRLLDDRVPEVIETPHGHVLALVLGNAVEVDAYTRGKYIVARGGRYAFEAQYPLDAGGVPGMPAWWEIVDHETREPVAGDALGESVCLAMLPAVREFFAARVERDLVRARIFEARNEIVAMERLLGQPGVDSGAAEAELTRRRAALAALEDERRLALGGDVVAPPGSGMLSAVTFPV